MKVLSVRHGNFPKRRYQLHHIKPYIRKKPLPIHKRGEYRHLVGAQTTRYHIDRLQATNMRLRREVEWMREGLVRLVMTYGSELKNPAGVSPIGYSAFALVSSENTNDFDLVAHLPRLRGHSVWEVVRKGASGNASL